MLYEIRKISKGDIDIIAVGRNEKAAAEAVNALSTLDGSAVYKAYPKAENELEESIIIWGNFVGTRKYIESLDDQEKIEDTAYLFCFKENNDDLEKRTISHIAETRLVWLRFEEGKNKKAVIMSVNDGPVGISTGSVPEAIKVIEELMEGSIYQHGLYSIVYDGLKYEEYKVISDAGNMWYEFLSESEADKIDYQGYTVRRWDEEV